ncbi:MAG: Fe-Mn family superoxide dismutase [bacterium]
MTFIEKKFIIPELEGISSKTIEEHLKLYSGYVKGANLIQERITGLRSSSEEITNNTYLISELQRRFSFEFDGMRNHEYYFEQFEGGPKIIDEQSALAEKIKETWISVELWLARFKEIAMTRGIGWAVLYFDKKTNTLEQSWVEEQHLGHLVGTNVILALDMWEHSYMLDYVPNEKKKYVDAFFQNLNYSVVEKRFTEVV